MEKAPGTTSTLVNKIIIPVITTVLGTTAIYFLGFNKKGSDRSDMEAMLLTKESTLKAWKSFVAIQNISYKNIESLTEEYTEKIQDAVSQKGMEGTVPVLKTFKEEVFRESDKANQDIEVILNNDDIDPGFTSMLKRTLDNGKDQEKKVNEFFDDLIALVKSDIDQAEKGRKWLKETEKFVAMGKKSEERAANEAEAIAKTLSERYGQPFDLNELQVYVDYKKEKENGTGTTVNTNTPRNDGKAPGDPNATDDYVQAGDHQNNEASNETKPTTALLTGEWKMNGGDLELSKNGDMFWTFDNKGYTSGTWKLADGKLQMKATNPDNGKTSLLVGFLSEVTQNSFTMTFMTTPKEVYYFKRTTK